MYNMPVGQPWQMIAVDVLKVPPSTHNNRYLLVTQDYFTKWATTIPMADRTTVCIKTELTKLFSVMELPQVVHSDQWANVETTILKQTLQAYCIKSQELQHTILKVMAWLRDSFAHYCSFYDPRS